MLDPVANSDIIPYSIIISPTDTETMPAIYLERRNQPLISKPSDYYLAVTGVRFDTTSVPFLHFPSAVDPMDPNNRNYSNLIITLVYRTSAGVIHQFPVHVTYYPEKINDDLFIIENNSPSVYYDVFNPGSYIFMVNQALEQAFNQILLIEPGLSPTVQAPYFYLNPGGKLTLEAQNIINPITPVNVYETQYNGLIPSYDTAQPNGTIQIFTNNSLFNTLGNFRYFETDDSIKKNLMIITNIQPKNNPTWFDIVQADNFTFLNSNVVRFVITSSSLPIVSTQVPVKTEYPIGTYAAYKFIFEYYGTSTSSTGLLNNISYNQQGFLRLYELHGSSPLDLIDLQFGYMTHQQKINTIQVTKDNCCSISMVFIKKSLFKK